MDDTVQQEVRGAMSNDTTTGAPVTAPVLDWATDYDIFDPGYVADPYGI